MASLVQSADLRSRDKVVDRIKAALEIASRKGKSDYDLGSLERALTVMVGLITSTQVFQDYKLLNMEDRLGPFEIPSHEEMHELYSRWWFLAKIAYATDVKILEEKLNEKDFHMLKYHAGENPGDTHYFVAFHPPKKHLVIGIRGTASLEDVATDVVASPQPHNFQPFCPISGSESGYLMYGHEGMLEAAKKIGRDLLPFIEHFVVPSGYSIQIVGHSLGGGVASLLAILLRSHFLQLHGAGLHAYCFAPAPVVDIKTASRCKDFITTVVNRFDMVPRLAMGNIEVFVRTLEGVLRVMEERGMNNFWKIAIALTFERDKRTQCISDDDLVKFCHILEESIAQVEVDDTDNMFTAGRVIFMFEKMDRKADKGEERYIETNAALLEPSHKILRYIEIGSDILDQHFFLSHDEAFEKFLNLEHNNELGDLLQ